MLLLAFCYLFRNTPDLSLIGVSCNIIVDKNAMGCVFFKSLDTYCCCCCCCSHISPCSSLSSIPIKCFKLEAKLGPWKKAYNVSKNIYSYGEHLRKICDPWLMYIAVFLSKIPENVPLCISLSTCSAKAARSLNDATKKSRELNIMTV